MKHGPLIALACMTAAVLSLAATPASQPAPAATPPSWDSYRLIVSRNMFARDRAAPTSRRYTPSPRRSENGEPELILTGVIVQEELRIAFFEDSRSGLTYRVPVGGVLGSVAVESISLDGVELRGEGRARRIAIGENLSGAAGTSLRDAASQPTTAAAGTSAESQPAGPPTDKGLEDILERMRQRRLQEMKS